MEAHQSTRLKTFMSTPCLQQILRIRWPDTISNEEHWRRTQQRPIPEAIKEPKWRWIGHTLQRDPTSTQDRHSTGTPKGSADKGVQPRLGEEA